MFRIPSIKLTECNKTIETSKYRIHYQRPCGGGDRLGALAFSTGTATTTPQTKQLIDCSNMRKRY